MFRKERRFIELVCSAIVRGIALFLLYSRCLTSLYADQIERALIEMFTKQIQLGEGGSK